jgi:hypothetical protein
VFQVDESRFDEVNGLDDVTIATLPQNMPVKAGTKLAGMRVIPLVIKKDKMEQVRQGGWRQAAHASEPVPEGLESRCSHDGH